jgi:hypothetical protein
MPAEAAVNRHERDMSPPTEFRSYYGRPILKEPAWKVPDVPLYLFLGGMAGSSASLAAAADLSGRPRLARAGHLVAAGGALASVGWLIHDLGRPARFLNMLRVFKVTSALSVGSWILSAFSGLTVVTAAAPLARRVPRLAPLSRLGRLTGLAGGALGPAMCTYTAVLLADTAVPAWHEAYPELPFLFAGSALGSGAGAALLAAPHSEQAPARRMAMLGASLELAATRRMEQRLGLVGEPYRIGRPGRLLKAAKVLTAVGAGLSCLGGRSRLAARLGGAALLAAGLCTRFGVFDAGMVSSRDPKYVVVPQRERLRARASAKVQPKR